MRKRSVGNDDEVYKTDSYLALSEYNKKTLVTHFDPRFKKANSDDPYQPVYHPSIPILSQVTEAIRVEDKNDLSVKSAMIFKGKKLFTETFVDNVKGFVKDFQTSKEVLSDLQKSLDERRESFDNLQKTLDKFLQSNIPEVRETAQCLSSHSQEKKQTLEEDARLALRAEAGLEGIAQSFANFVECHWDTIKSGEIDSENELMDTILANATDGTPADMAFKDDWRRHLRNKTDATRLQAYRDLSRLECTMMRQTNLLERKMKSKIRDRLKQSDNKTESVIESHACQDTEFQKRFYGRYGTDAKIPQSGSDWTQIWSQHQGKLVGDTRVRYELGTGANDAPVCLIMPEYTLEKGNEVKWHSITHPSISFFTCDEEWQGCNDDSCKNAFDIAEILSSGGQEGTPTRRYLKDVDRKIARLNDAATEVSQAQTALLDDEKGLAELKRIEKVVQEMRSTLPETMTAHMNTLYSDQVAHWKEQIAATEVIARKIDPAKGDLIHEWIDCMSQSLSHHDLRAGETLKALSGKLTNETTSAKEYKKDSEGWGNLARTWFVNLQERTDSFLDSFSKVFGSGTKVPSTAAEWHDLYNEDLTSWESTCSSAVPDVNQPLDYRSYWRNNSHSGPCELLGNSENGNVNLWFSNPPSLLNPDDETIRELSIAKD